MAGIFKINSDDRKTSQSRDWLIGLSALDWPNKKVFQMLDLLETECVSAVNLRVDLPLIIKKLSLTDYQSKSILNFISEYNFSSFKEWLQQEKIRVVTRFDFDYPAELKQLKTAPPALWIKGRWLEKFNLIGVVGSRHPSLAGSIMTENLVGKIIKLGFGVVSGFMYGADQAAQQQALKLNGVSMGVLGYGVNQVYPASFYTLKRNFLYLGGCLISPFPPWARPQKWRFLKRNFLVAGLAKAVVVTEATVGSGSHSTVKSAIDLAKPVGVLPSSPDSPFFAGENALLAEGVSSVKDINKFLAGLKK